MNAYDPQAYTISCVDSIQTEMATRLHLAPVGNKAVDLDFDGGLLSSDAGLMLLKDPDEQLGLTRALAAVLKDPRDPRRVHFTLHDLLKQRVLQIAAGYEDANDANTLRHDPIFKLLLDLLPLTFRANNREKNQIELSSWDEQTDHSQARANRRYPGHHRAVKEDARGQIDRHPLPDQRQLDGIESRRSGGRLVDLHHLRGRPPALSGRAVGRGAQADAPPLFRQKGRAARLHR